MPATQETGPVWQRPRRRAVLHPMAAGGRLGYTRELGDVAGIEIMSALDPVVFRQIPVIRQIILDETWLEGERRGCCVRAGDRVVRENVCRVVLRIGAQLRESSQRAVAAGPAKIPSSTLPEAA